LLPLVAGRTLAGKKHELYHPPRRRTGLPRQFPDGARMPDLMSLIAVPRVASPHSSGALPGYPQSRLLNDAHAYWLACRSAAEMPSWRTVNTAALDPLRPHTILFEVQREPLDFRYAEIGSTIRGISNSDLTGTLMSALPHQQPPSKVWDHLSGAVDAHAPVKGVLPYVGRQRDINSIYHIVLPLADDGETVDRLLVCVDIGPSFRLQDGTPPFSQLG